MFSFSAKVFGAFSILVASASFVSLDAQTRKRTKPVKKPIAAQPKKEESKVGLNPVVVTTKRNERPANETAVSTKPSETSIASTTTQTKPDPAYFYEFSQPEFITNRVVIEHDDQGKGTIAFTRRGSTEVITDPIQISAKALEKLKGAFVALHFHDSTENYQHERDFSHLGVVRIVVTKSGRERSTTFNYTANKDAKLLADEYRKVANQALWIFDITSARENQPLESPNQMNVLESLIKRDEISDGEQMLPFLRELSDDERIPLIARNHAARIVQTIERSVKKNK